MSIRSRIATWIARYGAAELAGTVTALAGAWLARALTGNEVMAAYGGAIGENVGYYGSIAARDLLGARRARVADGLAFGAREAALVGRDIAAEFGPGELLDSAVVRPLLMGLGARWFGGSAGVLAGKLAADVVFYAVIITAHEARLRRLAAESTVPPPR